MTDLLGHDWERGFTCRAGITTYKCRACGQLFHHHYKRTPSLAEALRNYAGVIDRCEKEKQP